MALAAAHTPEKERRNARWFGLRELVAIVAGIVLYAILSWFTSFANLSGGLGIELRPAIVIPIIFGFVYGPIVGFAIGTLGGLVTDYWLYGDIWWQWSVGTGIMGLIPGLHALYWRVYRSLRDQIAAFVITVIGIVLGMGFASFSSIAICQEGIAPPQCFQVPVTFNMAMDTFLSVVRVNVISAIILVPLLLYNIARLDLSAINWMGSGLLRRLLIGIAVSAALPIALLGFFLVQQFTVSMETSNVIVQLLGTVVVTLLFTIANASLVAQTLNRPLLRLTRAAELMVEGKLAEDQVQELQQTVGDDEISNLSRMFGNMAQEVIQREVRLRRQVEELRIKIDEDKKQQAVEEITETDFFRDLQDKSRNLRNRRQETPTNVLEE